MILINEPRRRYLENQAAYDQAYARVHASGRYILGTECRAFEEEFASYIGVSKVIGLGTGTDALILGLRALGAGPGVRVFTVANAGFYTSIAARLVGAELVYVDIDPATSLIAPSALSGAGAGDILVITHLFGNAVSKDVFDTARKLGMHILEDCAQAHGAMVDGRRAGSIGDIATFSFYPTKNLGAFGDGGAIGTNSDALAARVAEMRQYGWSDKYRVVSEHGTNSRLDDMQAAVLRVGLKLLDGWNARRREIIDAYRSHLPSGVACVTASTGSSAAHLAVLHVQDREAARKMFADADIATDIHYPTPDHRQPVWNGAYDGLALPVTEQAASRLLSVPLAPELSADEVRRISSVISQLSG